MIASILFAASLGVVEVIGDAGRVEVSFRTPDSKDDGDYMRRAQMMFMSPFPQSNEWMKPVGVLDRSEAVRRCYAKYNRVHYRLVPYLYSLFREQVKTGVGVVRAPRRIRLRARLPGQDPARGWHLEDDRPFHNRGEYDDDV